ncbi:DUF2971 domain-containing protein [Kiloniella majae]|uniref:DUF2971 domain-containing protein n=1 Tax=Kiloniella majae TaxID=1938558 RepID=UPI000A278AA4|nr:DUF2971 domain-containing protein [Kiloniella majae]
MDGDNIYDLFNPIDEFILDIEDSYPSIRPLLAHYTNLTTAEEILKRNEIWLSNPLFMNDYEEVRFGVNNGLNLARQNENLKQALSTNENLNIFSNFLDDHYHQYDNSDDEKDVFNTYIFCLSEHEDKNSDGLLSMWRGYGDTGRGVALVFDTSKIKPIHNSPLILGKVSYGSQEDRIKKLTELISSFADILKSNNLLSRNDLFYSAWALFERIKIFALFTKHNGFHEEQEWRLVYRPELDHANQFKTMKSYFNGPNGIEPKLKLQFDLLNKMLPEPLEFEEIIHRIIIGPSSASVLSERSTKLMLEMIGKQNLVPKVSSSSTPFRSK